MIKELDVINTSGPLQIIQMFLNISQTSFIIWFEIYCTLITHLVFYPSTIYKNHLLELKRHYSTCFFYPTVMYGTSCCQLWKAIKTIQYRYIVEENKNKEVHLSIHLSMYSEFERSCKSHFTCHLYISF